MRRGMTETRRVTTARCLEHVRYLAETIGPRGSTTAGEAAAAEYAAAVYEGLGLEAQVQQFKSAISAWRPYALALALALLALALYPVAGRWTAGVAAAIVAFAIVSSLLELNFMSNPLRWLLPKGHSHNVWAVVPPRGRARRRVVLVGHLDTHRTPFVFKSAGHLRLFALLVPLGFGSMGALVVLFIAGTVSGGTLWIHVASVVAGLGVAAILMVLVQADFTPYTPGANDNASGAAMVLTLAERLLKEPLKETEVWALNTGCEEVGCYGAESFVREHRDELEGAFFIVFDSVGGPGAGACFITWEGMTRRYRPDKGLLSLARSIASARADLRAYEKPMRLGYTEGAIGVKYGLRTLTFVGLDRQNGILPLWHQPADTAENLDPQTLADTEEFAWELLQRIDAGEGDKL